MMETMLVLSTAHLTEGTCSTWLHHASLVAYPKGDVGWFVHVPDSTHGDVPADLAECLEQARALNCDWIMFDRDAAALTILPVHAWGED